MTEAPDRFPHVSAPSEFSLAIRVGLVAAMLCGATLADVAPTQAQAASSSNLGTALPNVTGPIADTDTSHAFGGAAYQRVPEDLSEVGYVEGEYFVSGEANVYEWPEPGPAVVRTTNVPYTTRILVRQPSNRNKFSGNVVVEMLNPSNFFDLNIGWAMMSHRMIENGDAWVGVTVKPICIDALKTFDPERYGSLAMPNPFPLDDPRNCTTIYTRFEGDSFRTSENGLVWDIFSQVGALMRSNAPSSPIHATVSHVYGFGFSQTGGYLRNYINAIHPLVVSENSRSIYDGYIVAVSSERFAHVVPINQCVPPPQPGDIRLQLPNVDVPIIQVMSQSDYLRGILGRRSDSDDPNGRFRYYEMAGAGHATPDELLYSASSEDIVQSGRAVPPMDCNEGPRSRFPSQIFFDAILRNLDEWVRYDIAPPHADLIQVVNGQPVLDDFGNVMGGLRSPYLEVPTSTWNGSSTGPSFCAIAGHEIPFSQERLNELYSTHGSYVDAVIQSTQELVGERIITPTDGQEIILEAAQADVP